MLTNPEIELVVGHCGFDAAIANRATVIERQFAIDHIGNEVGLALGQATHGIGLDLVFRLEEVFIARETITENEGVVEHGFNIIELVQHIRCRIAGEQQSAARCRVDVAIPGIHRDREHRTLLPFENDFLLVAFLPDFRGAAAFDDEEDFLVHVLLRIKRTTRGHFNHIAAPFRFRAVELDEMAFATATLPVEERQVLHLADANAAEDRNALGFHPRIIGGRLFLELAEACFAGA